MCSLCPTEAAQAWQAELLPKAADAHPQPSFVMVSLASDIHPPDIAGRRPSPLQARLWLMPTCPMVFLR